ncbi:MAG: hypothetical protein LAT68_10590 [Cyclobacteriaceae bacterium]|nr:hypothetical protein [Cyclobacteriaceae bacterium]MCH8516763.1 hypothetical protein [Cyclobacteriaceae bacterium]
MIFKGTENQTLEFKILNYQYPESEDEFDGNWLKIHIKVNATDGSWEATYPALLAQELKKMLEWLYDFHQGRLEKDDLFDSMEQAIFLQSVSQPEVEPYHFQILLDTPFLPPFQKKEGSKYIFDIVLDKVEFKKMLNALEKEYKRFPYRDGLDEDLEDEYEEDEDYNFEKEELNDFEDDDDLEDYR